MPEDEFKKQNIEEIVGQYLKPVFNFVYRLSGDSAAATDIAQEVFIKVWKNLERYDPAKNFKTWLFAIARHTTIDWLRRQRPLPFSALESGRADDDTRADFADTLIDEEALPDELFAQAELKADLEEVLAKIPLDQRTVILLHLQEDLSFDQVAEVVDRPLNTVKSQYRRGLLALRAFLLAGKNML